MKAFITIGLSFLFLEGLSQTRTIATSGNWSDAASWQGGNIGGAVDNDDDVVLNANTSGIILNGETYTIATFTTGKKATLTIDAGGALIINTLTADNEMVLNIDGDLTIQADFIVNKKMTLNVTGTFTVLGNIIAAGDAVLDIQGTVNVSGDLITDKNAVVNVDGALNIDGDLNLGNGSVITGAGTVAAGSCSGAACGSVLPVELAYFEVNVESSHLNITWSTVSELNNDFFTLERSSNGIDYHTLAHFQGAGTSSGSVNYQYIDSSPLYGQSYYRLKQTDYDGTTEVFSPKGAYISGVKSLNIFPNPAQQGDELNIITGAQEGETVMFYLYNASGNLVMNETLSGTASYNLINRVDAGLYTVKVLSGKNIHTQKLLVQ